LSVVFLYASQNVFATSSNIAFDWQSFVKLLSLRTSGHQNRAESPFQILNRLLPGHWTREGMEFPTWPTVSDLPDLPHYCQQQGPFSRYYPQSERHLYGVGQVQESVYSTLGNLLCQHLQKTRSNGPSSAILCRLYRHAISMSRTNRVK
jgi:hypothetical protein